LTEPTGAANYKLFVPYLLRYADLSTFYFWLFADIGVLYWQLDPKKSESEEELAKIRKERGYSYMVCPNLPPYVFDFLYMIY